MVAAIAVEVIALTTALAPPILTVAPVANPVPVTSRTVPPRVEPDVGLTEVMVGAGAGGGGGVTYVNNPVPVPLW